MASEAVKGVTISYPADQDPIARYNIALDEGIRTEDGQWEVTRTLKQVVTFDKSMWFVREYKVKSLDTSFAKANRTTLKSVNNLLTEYDRDFFSKTEWDHNQYVMATQKKSDVLEDDFNGKVETV